MRAGLVNMHYIWTLQIPSTEDSNALTALVATCGGNSLAFYQGYGMRSGKVIQLL